MRSRKAVKIITSRALALIGLGLDRIRGLGLVRVRAWNVFK